MSRAAPPPGRRRLGFFLGLAAFLAALACPRPEGMEPEAQRTAAVALLMALWWTTEALPFAATALIPLAAFPLMGVVPALEASQSYGDPNIFLFAGGFFIAMAMMKWNLHTRIALWILCRTGSHPRALTGGFMLATAALSMWISNTATALMMLPIALAVVEMFGGGGERRGQDRFALCLLLGIAYAASIGGMATLVGTPPNVLLASQFERLFPQEQPIGFLQWMAAALPVSLVLLFLAWWLLAGALFRFGAGDVPGVEGMLEERLARLGPMSAGERVVLEVWLLTVLAWIFRSDIDLGFLVVEGWGGYFPSGHVHNGTVAMAGALLLFCATVDPARGERALDWEWAQRIPWGTLLLFGGGLALARGMDSSGLVAWLGGRLEFLQGLPPWLILLCLVLLCIFLTELASNMASAAILLPILGGSLAPALGIHPLALMAPATMAVNCAFMLPVATPPNAIVFGSGRISIPQMCWAGFWINLAGAVLITFAGAALLPLVFPLRPLP